MKSLKADHPHLVLSHINIGCAHLRNDDYQQTLASYKKAYDIIKKAFGESHPNIAMCLNNMGCVYEREQSYTKAFECHPKALEICQEYLPVHHPDIGQSHITILVMSILLLINMTLHRNTTMSR